MNKREIGKEIIRGLEEIKAWKRGELKLKTYTVAIPKAADVPAIRKELGLSQPEFAGFMGVSLGTLRNWEQERREPHGPARALLLVASKQPAAVRAAFESAKPAFRAKPKKAQAQRSLAGPRANPDSNPDKVSGYGPAASMWRRIPPSIPPKWRDSGLVHGGT